jgi:N-acetylglucosamine-6-sulfatase
MVGPCPVQPNILFIFSDDHAVRAISAYGDSLNRTPNIDRIASEGVLFRNNFCANSICAPSRACVLTGKHSHANGLRTNRDRFDGTQTTFPKLLQAAGYRTAIVGKWHLQSDPVGFDYWEIYPGQGSYYNPEYKTAQGLRKTTGYSVELTTDRAVAWMREQSKTPEPFLLMCQFKAPHRTWAPGPKHLDLYADTTFPLPDTFYDTYKGRASPAARHRMGIREHMRMDYDLKVPARPDEKVHEVVRMTPEQRATWDRAFGPRNAAFKKAGLKGRALAEWKYQRYIKNYLRCVAAVDDGVGRLLDELERLGLDDNTIVVYSSDQGFFLGEHGWFDKRWMYEE